MKKNFSFSLDALILRPSAKTITATNSFSPVLTTSNYTTSKALNHNLNFSSGFRIQGSYFHDAPLRVYNIRWTSYGASCSENYVSELNNAINLNQQGSFPAWNISSSTIASDYVAQTSFQWRLLMNMIELIFQKECKYKGINFSPSIGISTLWLNQNFNVNYFSGVYQQSFISPGFSNFTPVNIFMKNNYFGIGPRVGLDGEIGLINGFSFYALGSFTSLAGNFNVSQKGNYLGENIFTNSKNPFGVRCLFNCGLGFMYKMGLFNNRYRFSCKIGYEFLEFFNIYNLQKDKYHVLSQNSNLNLQGVILNASIDF